MINRRTWLQLAAAGVVGAMSSAPLSVSAQDGDKDLSKLFLQGVDADGKKIELTDYLGKTILVSFFTAGCSVCSRDFKLMRDFYARNVQRNFMLLGVNLDPHKADFDQYNQLISLAVPKNQRFPTVWRPAPGFKDNFGPIVREPTHFVINAKNEFIFKREGSFQPEDWDNLWSSLG